MPPFQHMTNEFIATIKKNMSYEQRQPVNQLAVEEFGQNSTEALKCKRNLITNITVRVIINPLKPLV